MTEGCGSSALMYMPTRVKRHDSYLNGKVLCWRGPISKCYKTSTKSLCYRVIVPVSFSLSMGQAVANGECPCTLYFPFPLTVCKRTLLGPDRCIFPSN